MKRFCMVRLAACWLFQVAGTFCALSTCNSAAAATTVGGFITTNTHWQLTGSPYIASSSILVDSGATLTIDPGVEVRFAPTTGLVVVNGKLSARGSSGSQIKFTADQLGDANRWNGIQFGDQTVDATFDINGNYVSGSIIEFATIESIAKHSNGSIRIESSAPFIHESTVQNNLSTGILGLNLNGLRLVGNRIKNNALYGYGGGGIGISVGSGVLIQGNEITDNYGQYRGGGVYIADGSNNTIKDNIIQRNFGKEWGAGIDSFNSDNLVVVGNYISNNTGATWRSSGVDLQFGDNPTLTNNVITGNIGAAGVGVENTAGLSLTGNQINNNDGDGMYFREYVTSAVVSANASNPTTIFGNGGFEIHNDQLFEGTTGLLARGNVDARNVWWRTTDVPTIQSGIYDFFDNSTKGIVFTNPIATSAPPRGDFNGNGIVDATDYVVWRKSGGSQTNYQIWRANFGTTAAGNSSVVANVPEPPPVVLVVILIWAIAFHGRLLLTRRVKK